MSTDREEQARAPDLEEAVEWLRQQIKTQKYNLPSGHCGESTSEAIERGRMERRIKGMEHMLASALTPAPVQPDGGGEGGRGNDAERLDTLAAYVTRNGHFPGVHAGDNWQDVLTRAADALAAVPAPGGAEATVTIQLRQDGSSTRFEAAKGVAPEWVLDRAADAIRAERQALINCPIHAQAPAPGGAERREEIRTAVQNAMQSAWNEWIIDTGGIPDDFRLSRSVDLQFIAGPWASEVASRIIFSPALNAILTLPTNAVPGQAAGGEVERLRARIGELERQVYVPGLWRCAKCGFKVIQANLNAPDGSVTARNEPGEHCPNDGSPLWPVTEREAGNEACDRLEQALSEAAQMVPGQAGGGEVGVAIKAAEEQIDNFKADWNEAVDAQERPDLWDRVVDFPIGHLQTLVRAARPSTPDRAGEDVGGPDAEMAEFLKGVVGAVEANSFEKHALWKMNTERKQPLPWNADPSGFTETIGYVGDMPVCVHVSKVTVDSHLILIYDATSAVVDHRMVRSWLERVLPQSAYEDGRIKVTDANNFHNVFRREVVRLSPPDRLGEDVVAQALRFATKLRGAADRPDPEGEPSRDAALRLLHGCRRLMVGAAERIEALVRLQPPDRKDGGQTK